MVAFTFFKLIVFGDRIDFEVRKQVLRDLKALCGVEGEGGVSNTLSIIIENSKFQ